MIVCWPSVGFVEFMVGGFAYGGARTTGPPDLTIKVCMCEVRTPLLGDPSSRADVEVSQRYVSSILNTTGIVL